MLWGVEYNSANVYISEYVNDYLGVCGRGRVVLVSDRGRRRGEWEWIIDLEQWAVDRHLFKRLSVTVFGPVLWPVTDVAHSAYLDKPALTGFKAHCVVLRSGMECRGPSGHGKTNHCRLRQPLPFPGYHSLWPLMSLHLTLEMTARVTETS